MPELIQPLQFNMRVLHFYRTYSQSYGGIEQVIYQLCVGANSQGIQAQVLTLSRDMREPQVDLEGHTVVRAKLNFEIASTGFSFSALKKFRQLAEQADIIHYHFPWPFMDVVHFAAGVKKPTVLTYHSDIVRQWFLLSLYRPLMRRLLASVDRIVVASPNYLASSTVLSHYKSKVEVIPFGLDRHSYPVPTPQNLKAWTGRVGTKFFLFVGVLRYYKGLHILLDAARGSNYPIIIVGAGPIEASLKRQARKHGLDHVHFLGAVSDEDKVALLTSCYAVVFPSHLRSEAFGISLLEGAMHGKPMISSEIGTGTSFINVHEKTGLVVPPSNPQAFREAMDMLWNHPDRAKAMGHQAAMRYQTLFTATKMSQSYADLYRQMLAPVTELAENTALTART